MKELYELDRARLVALVSADATQVFVLSTLDARRVKWAVDLLNESNDFDFTFDESDLATSSFHDVIRAIAPDLEGTDAEPISCGYCTRVFRRDALLMSEKYLYVCAECDDYLSTLHTKVDSFFDDLRKESEAFKKEVSDDE